MLYIGVKVRIDFDEKFAGLRRPTKRGRDHRVGYSPTRRTLRYADSTKFLAWTAVPVRMLISDLNKIDHGSCEAVQI
jgi:hypothetical protein